MIKIQSLNFQRNGVHGDSFYTCAFTDNKKPLIATFDAHSNDGETEEFIPRISCRVINPADLSEKFRGDEYAFQLKQPLNELQKKHKTADWYDLTKIEKL